jgi:N-acetylmuramate 1-kinase
MVDRDAAREVFLRQAGWAGAKQAFLAGDASDRSYQRLTKGPDTAVLMDAPPGKGDDPAAFIAVAQHLAAIGLSAPRVLAQDLSHGYLLLEDFGDAVFAAVLEKTPQHEGTLYAVATDALAVLQSQSPLAHISDLSAVDWASAATFAVDWYRHAITADRVDSAPFRASLADAIADHADGPRCMILRDYHAENLIWLPSRQRAARAGLLDFQLAQMGQPVYDLVSLLQDARRDVSPETVTQTQRQFCRITGCAHDALMTAYAIWGAQRALRILGVFARLCLVSDKPGYLLLLPRVWGHLQANLAHPALASFAEICRDLLPEPTPAAIKRIADQAGRSA